MELRHLRCFPAVAEERHFVDYWHRDRVFAGAASTTLRGVDAERAAPENRQDGDRVIVAGRDTHRTASIRSVMR